MKSLVEIYANYSGPDGFGDKGTAHSYLPVYRDELTMRDDISLLEIGVCQGHSIKMWMEYFSNSEILGLDIDLTGVIFEDLPVAKCNATKAEELDLVLGDRLFDYIIDDGSHQVQDQIASLELLWPRIKDQGKYFIEDIKSDAELLLLQAYATSRDYNFRSYDLRATKGRADDILLVITKEHLWQ